MCGLTGKFHEGTNPVGNTVPESGNSIEAVHLQLLNQFCSKLFRVSIAAAGKKAAGGWQVGQHTS